MVEHVTDKPKPGQSLGTGDYEPTFAETPFFRKVSEAEQTTGGMVNDSVLEKRGGSYVGWFGIVREVTKAKGTTSSRTSTTPTQVMTST